MSAPKPAYTPDIKAAIFAGCLVAFIGFGFSATFGVFLAPMSHDLGWGREVFSLSIAVQTLVWGFTQPFAGMAADRFGTARVLAVGALLSALGFLLRGLVTDPTLFVLSGIPVGMGTGACSFPVVLAALGKVVTAEQRSFVMGLGTAAASFGMFAAAQTASTLIQGIGWQPSIFIVAASFLAILPFLFAISRVSKPTAGGGAGGFRDAIGDAFRDRSFLCLFFGFYVCGFHVAFIGTHLPAYITDLGLSASIGGWSLSLIGLFNIVGSLTSGWLGQRHSKKRMLASLYTARAVVITIFLLTPVSATTILIFSCIMGLLWLATVPLTMGLVAQTQGLTYLATLSGLVFLSHQVGGFTGAWLGGRIYDAVQDYTPMWWAAVALGLLAALIHVPIQEDRAPKTA